MCTTAVLLLLEQLLALLLLMMILLMLLMVMAMMLLLMLPLLLPLLLPPCRLLWCWSVRFHPWPDHQHLRSCVPCWVRVPTWDL